MSGITLPYSITVALLLAAAVAHAQDPHFAGVQELNIWYNPALKTNKDAVANIRLRNVNYPGIISYSSKAATIELPLLSKEDKGDDATAFVNLAAGGSTDKSNDNFMSTSTAMLALSYALPLNNNNTYMALGFQGNYSYSRVGTGSYYEIPNQFDKYGALAAVMAADPYQSGFNHGYFTAGVGVALFHTEEEKQWYIGGSIRHFNRPYREWSHTTRLPANDGIQGGYTAAISSADNISGYGNFTWQAGTSEQIAGIRYSRYLDDSTRNAFFIGVSYRAGDAIIPDAALHFGKSQLACYYELNTAHLPSGRYPRRTWELSYSLIL
ncbi:hypothetical protein F0L74_15190 [Chitinophaga agrisoli]|uniref:Type IX secretion system PorP/SprF family membrane protein n=1 Tax=Chitinophaga agrisoli TaxID=2607653 RepID=A0A5B2W087_9BACT|nr:hypothetical protein [Chitinophaga agrisoli]KAA2243817.1 hypothetical protein F0L74_15190 [Chitinophaga agrisoli]